MKAHLLALAAAAVSLCLVTPAATQTPDFQWTGTVATGGTLEIRGVNGDVRAIASQDASAAVEAVRRARRSDPESVRIEVVEHAGGVTICAVYPRPARSQRENRCVPGGAQNNVQDNDVRVDFVVRVPAGVAFAGHTVNGDLDADALRSDVTASTVNGGVSIRTTGFVSRASTVNGSILIELPAGLNAQLDASTVNGSIDSDFPIRVVGRTSRGALRGTIGGGGPALRASTVNGNIRLREI